MAQVSGEAGKTARFLHQQRRRRRKLMLLAVMVVLVVIMVLMFSVLPRFLTLPPALNYLATGIILLVIIAMKIAERNLDDVVDSMVKEEENALKGARGEDAVGALLRQLPPTYHVFHNIQKVAGDIDHVVVGPNGIFVLETKANHGKVSAQGDVLLLNGHPPEKNFLTQVRGNAKWVHDVLANTIGEERYVVPIVVFTQAFVQVRRRVGNVQVVNRKYLLRAITTATGKPVPVERVVAILRQKMGK